MAIHSNLFGQKIQFFCGRQEEEPIYYTMDTVQCQEEQVGHNVVDWMNNIQEDCDCDTDFTFCHDEEYEQADCSDGSEQNSTLGRACVKLRVGGRKKAKTIFSLDLPLQTELPIPAAFQQSQYSGPGEFGDGYSLFKENKQDIKDDQVQNESDNIPEGRSDSSALCKIRLPFSKSSTLILAQPMASLVASNYPANERFTATFHLENPTSCKQAYKVYCNSSAWFHFTVRPHSGVIPAHGRIPVQVNTKVDRWTRKPPTNDILSHDQFTIKFFPAYFATDEYRAGTSKGTLNAFLKRIDDQCPELIHPQTIRHVVLCDASDTLTNLPSINKTSLYHHSGHHLEMNRGLRYSQLKISADNETLRKILRRIRVMGNILAIVHLFVLCGFIGLFVMPFLTTEVVVQEEVEETWWGSHIQDIFYPFFSLFQSQD